MNNFQARHLICQLLNLLNAAWAPVRTATEAAVETFFANVVVRDNEDAWYDKYQELETVALDGLQLKRQDLSSSTLNYRALYADLIRIQAELREAEGDAAPTPGHLLISPEVSSELLSIAQELQCPVPTCETGEFLCTFGGLELPSEFTGKDLKDHLQVAWRKPELRGVNVHWELIELAGVSAGGTGQGPNERLETRCGLRVAASLTGTSGQTLESIVRQLKVFTTWANNGRSEATLRSVNPIEPATAPVISDSEPAHA